MMILRPGRRLSSRSVPSNAIIPRSLYRNKRLTADAGAFSLAGKAATLSRTRKLEAAAGGFAMAGQAADLVATSPVGSGLWFNLTAGLDPLGGVLTGYNVGYDLQPAYGSIDRQPIEGVTVNDCASYEGIAGVIRWTGGDVSAQLVGKKIYIDGVGFPFSYVYGDEDYTQADFDSEPLAFVVGQTYLIDIRV